MPTPSTRPNPHKEAAAHWAAGRKRSAAHVYRRAMRRGWKPKDAETERLVLDFIAAGNT